MFRSLILITSLLFGLIILGLGFGAFIFFKYGQGLPDYKQLADYEPSVITRVHAGDGRLLAEYAEQKRVFVPFGAIPKLVVNAFLSAEDKNFYYHPGIDPMGIIRAILINIKSFISGRKLVGASTITQQVAKNFLLSADVTLDRKIKEAILAFRIERALTKNRILELYLNEIYLGFGSYGIATAALNYFNKALNNLTISEAAFLAALPKAPNNYNPFNHPRAAKSRRDWVIGRMLEDKLITPNNANLAILSPLITRKREETEYVKADYFAEEVRRELSLKYGNKALYRGGLVVRSTISPEYQHLSDKALRNGLIKYDKRHGWRGPIRNIGVAEDWLQALSKVPQPKALGSWRLAVVTKLTKTDVSIIVDDGSEGLIQLNELKWARKWIKGELLGPKITWPNEVLKIGDVIIVDQVKVSQEINSILNYRLRQLPEIEGALVVINAHTGRVLAMSGGFSYERSQFNRAMQAKRQPGSAFKPFVYLAALDNGFTPSSLILDAPFVIEQGFGKPKWRPANYSGKFYGLSTMRLGIEKSRNLMTVRLAQTVGMEIISKYARDFGVFKNLPIQLSMALGAGETTLFNLTRAYAMIVNGGKKIETTLIDRIQDRNGNTIFRHDKRKCNQCRTDFWTNQGAPNLINESKQIISPTSAFQMVSMLHGAVQRGTGKIINDLGIPLGGKTGTTNQSMDTWFIGFSPDLAVGVFVGFDKPRSLGKREQGASVAAPIFKEFMRSILSDKPAIPFRIPSEVSLVRVNAETGELAELGDQKVILEAFKPGTAPIGFEQTFDASEETLEKSNKLGIGTLY
ncbi:MAG: penicillin-binding protein 1A [Rhodospirillales bacterium]|tara:strand:+ start:16058 stop:18469 length:2412 start_codon:yes stop_codon:yes gene_type:complete